MGTKRRVALWYRDGDVIHAKPPDWPRECEYSCTSRETLIEWARNHNYVLRDGNPPKQDRRLA